VATGRLARGHLYLDYAPGRATLVDSYYEGDVYRRIEVAKVSRARAVRILAPAFAWAWPVSEVCRWYRAYCEHAEAQRQADVLKERWTDPTPETWWLEYREDTTQMTRWTRAVWDVITPDWRDYRAYDPRPTVVEEQLDMFAGAFA
jgi:hypothetical protein